MTLSRNETWCVQKNPSHVFYAAPYSPPECFPSALKPLYQRSSRTSHRGASRHKNPPQKQKEAFRPSRPLLGRSHSQQCSHQLRQVVNGRCYLEALIQFFQSSQRCSPRSSRV